jgi:hypothetical protein
VAFSCKDRKPAKTSFRVTGVQDKILTECLVNAR